MGKPCVLACCISRSTHRSVLLFALPELQALKVAAKIGRVSVDMNGTACKVPSAPEYIKKVQERGAIGKKRKTTKC